MKILSNDEIRSLEQHAAERGETGVGDQIANAGMLTAREIAARWDPSVPVSVFAGWGNNGADALSAAANLLDAGYTVTVYLFSIKGKSLSSHTRVLRDALKARTDEALTLHVITGRESFIMPQLTEGDLVVDGLFGSGLTGRMPRVFEQMAQSINDSGAAIVSIDMPSGLLDEDNTGNSVENMIHATLTLAQTAPRLSFVLADYADAVGEWKVMDIGVPADALRAAPFSFFVTRPSAISRLLRPRAPFSSKADYGSALVIAGQTGMYGAAVMAATGALRAGAGKVTVHSAAEGMTVLQTAVPAAMFRADANATHVTDMTGTDRYDAVAVGSGIGTANDTLQALETLLKTNNAAGRPLVIDADALNCIALKPMMLDYVPVLSVLTPHAGEFDRMFGHQESDWQRLEKARSIAAFNKVIIVLKGRFTAIVRPDGKVFFNASGSPAMATPGSGDVLTGVIAALMAQGYKPEKATMLACCIHGVAGQIAAADHGDYGVLATDIADNIGRAIRQIMALSKP